MSDLITNKKELRKGIDALTELYFSQPRVMFSHLFSSYHQFIEEMIPYSLEEESNYFYDNVTKDSIYLYGFKFSDTKILPPVRERDNEIVFPQMARKNFLNYFANINAKVTQFQEKIDLVTGERTRKNIGSTEEVIVASVPIMVKSKYCATHLKPETSKYECKYDPGGYFIVGGQEKVIVSIEKMIDNKILVFGKTDSSYLGGKMYTSQINSRKHDWSENLQIIAIRNSKDGSLVMTTSQLNEIPVLVMLRALGIETDKEIVARITNDLDDIQMINLLRNSLENCNDDEGNPIKTREEAIQFLLTKIKSGRRISQSDEAVATAQKKILLDKIFSKDLLPHLGNDVPNKAAFICLMIKKILRVMLKRDKGDDRDAFENKRVETPGVLLGQLFRQNFNKMLKEIGKLFRKKNNSDETPINMVSQIKPTTIEQGIKSGLATGIWGLSKTKAGVAQSLSRLTWIQTISYLRRLKSPSMDTSTAKITTIRQVNNIQAFFVCNVETPEGQPIGIPKSLSLMATVTPRLESQTQLIIDILDKHPKLVHPFVVNPEDVNNMISVFHNGVWKGLLDIKEGMSFYKNLKQMRKEGKINKFVTITMDYFKKIIYIYTEAGRLIRPLIVVDDNQIKLTKKMMADVKEQLKGSNKTTGWNKILLKYPDIIDYEDIESSRNLLISMDLETLQSNKQNQDRKVSTKEEIIKPNRYGKYRYVRYTHSEFHPSMMLGNTVSITPFINHNPSPRAIIFYSQAKQAIGIYSTAYKDRMDISNILYHPQVPLVVTKASKYNRFIDLPSGENIIVAVMSYKGYNVEDSIMMNQTSLDRGLFRADSLRKYNSKIEKNPSSSQDDIFTKPDRNKVTGMTRGNYQKLNDKGFIPEETVINDKDILIGKVSPIQPTSDNKVFKDKSELYKNTVSGVVDRVHNNIFNSDGYEMISMRVRAERLPIIGDKFCLTPEHEVLTTLGWKTIDKVTIEDEVACLNKSGEIYYSRPSETYEFDFNGEMYSLQSQQVDLITTLDHKMYIKMRNKKEYVLEKAKNIIGKRIRYKKNGIWVGKEKRTFDIKNKSYPMDELLMFLGIWFAEGWTNNYQSNKNIIIAANKQRVKDKLKEIVPELGLKIPKTKSNKWRFYDITLYNYLKDFSVGAVNKSLPKWVFELSERQSRILMEGLVLGDGYLSKSNNLKYFTSSKKLCDDVSRLVLHCGWSANIYEREYQETTLSCGRVIKPTTTPYILSIVKNKNEPQVNHGHNKTQKGQNEEIINYNGKVYCLQVPDHIFYVRLNGKPVWTGNSTRAGQKGTIGITLPQRDMPFTAEGMIPDLIFNPHGMPTRMTMGQMIETLGSKLAANIGSLFDGTPFNNYDVMEIPKMLKELGMNEYGEEEMYNGMTGKKMKAKIFIGPIYYLRLKHMVLDKQHSRSLGPRQAITRQPMEGRSKDGGLKIGEMEKDSMVAHGIGQFLKERMMETSDMTKVVVCNKCGTFATKQMDKDYYLCTNCNNHTDFSDVAMPYAFKLMCQELTSVNIVPRIRADKIDL